MKDNLKTYHYGLALLKIIMLFFVILSHFWDVPSTILFSSLIYSSYSLSVPIFIFVSFFLSGKIIAHGTKFEIKKRVKRLLIPQIAWTFIYAISFFFLDISFDLDINITAKDILIQLFTGHCSKINASMWFQVDLIFVFIVLVAISFLANNKHKITFIFLIISSYFMQYSGINLFLNSYNLDIKYPLGRIMEILPIAIFGYYFYCYKNILPRQTAVSTFLSIFSIFIIEKYRPFNEIAGYGYQGVRLLFETILLFIIFYTIPETLIPNILKKIIIVLSKYNLGIYCMHRLVAKVLFLFLDKLHITNFSSSFYCCILIYFLCFVLAVLLSHLGKKIRIDTILC